MRTSAFAVAIIAAVVAAPAAHAQRQPPELAYDPWVSGSLTLVGGSIWLGTELLKPQLAPEECRWCDDELNSVDDSVRDALRWDDIDAGDFASNVAVVVAVPASAGALALAAGADDAWQHAPVDALIVAEATVVAAALNQVVKLSVGRQRPFVRALPGGEKRFTDHPDDNNLSFYSGHANLSFALAVSSGTVASMRGYAWAPAVWITGLTAATATSYLRIAADRHYFTDVLVGAAAGAAIGAALPLLLHQPTTTDAALPALAVVPGQESTLVVVSGAF